MGLKSEERGRIKTLSPQDIGHYKSLLSRLIESERPSLETEEWEGQRAFWTVLVRHLKKKLSRKALKFRPLLVILLLNNFQMKPWLLYIQRISRSIFLHPA